MSELRVRARIALPQAAKRKTDEEQRKFDFGYRSNLQCRSTTRVPTDRRGRAAIKAGRRGLTTAREGFSFQRIIVQNGELGSVVPDFDYRRQT